MSCKQLLLAAGEAAEKEVVCMAMSDNTVAVGSQSHVSQSAKKSASRKQLLLSAGEAASGEGGGVHGDQR